jgi:cold shock CspA family protein
MTDVHLNHPRRNGFRPTSKKPQPAATKCERVGTRTTGVVKFFIGGYGFIVPKGGGEDVYFSQSTLEKARIAKIKKDQAVSYELFKNLDGRSAGKTFADNLKLVTN